MSPRRPQALYEDHWVEQQVLVTHVIALDLYPEAPHLSLSRSADRHGAGDQPQDESKEHP